MRDGRTDSASRDLRRRRAHAGLPDEALQSPNALFRKTRFSRAFDSLAPHATRADAQSRCHVRHDRGHASPRCRALVRVQQVRRPRRRRAAGASAGERLADRPKRRLARYFPAIALSGVAVPRDRASAHLDASAPSPTALVRSRLTATERALRRPHTHVRLRRDRRVVRSPRRRTSPTTSPSPSRSPSRSRRTASTPLASSWRRARRRSSRCSRKRI